MVEVGAGWSGVADGAWWLTRVCGWWALGVVAGGRAGHYSEYVNKTWHAANGTPALNRYFSSLSGLALAKGDIELHAYVYNVPITKFRGITQRSGVLLRGESGWAEVSPFWDYDDSYSARWLLGAIDHAVHGFPAGIRKEILVNATIPAVDPEQAYSIAQTSGARTAKVKVADKKPYTSASYIENDLDRLAAVRQAIGSEAKIRIDVNARWSREEAIELIPRYDMAAGGLEYVEQPVQTVEDLAYVRKKVDVPIAADESIRRASDPFLVKKMGAADVVVLKNQPLGGVRPTLELAAELDMPVVVSSALESSVGLCAGLALAAALPQLPFACGLATSSLLHEDVTSEPLVAHNGMMSLRDVEPDLIEENSARVPHDLRQDWIARVNRMWEILRLQGLVNQGSIIWA
ncbi:O-succinylbenzoate synthase [Arcanobacterium pluranimalium]|uniref:o-succinylbenzoate synthase n=1 Tax=Arcanobacterium pluranimalium TaxID=108028 RepID=UPI0019563A44|nr:o-succinylbenzoate synthase [Arcanobacterium pluranimalium]MBM7825901.1 O-succinylbenzoate synthase [Arcanobacterium pluranimalium]